MDYNQNIKDLKGFWAQKRNKFKKGRGRIYIFL